MCTSLIYRDPNKGILGIGFNRDESFKRKPSLSPQLLESNSGKAIAPIDGEAGGTWIGVTQSGEIICLLNYYEATLKLLRNPVSRGLLVRSILLGERTPESYTNTELENYYPFKLFKVRREKTEIFIWDGKTYQTETDSETFTVFGSSFTQGPKAQVVRRETFDSNFRPSSHPDATGFTNIAKSFLSSHLPEQGALSPCMHRRDAHSVSRTVIVLDGASVYFSYKNSQPCEDGPEEDYNFTLTEFRTSA
ncbi:NRDE family protein [Leptospira licerasiae]|uniref:NRDE domain protein n=1 Tax=Leptospira licerasiae str. MMD4847 TaxID=1049971 RepID=A0ABP2RAA7_9LEPT|nr:NRDE family protein [Leptospira licerasiae]EIE03158.1 NRDE domain protein [Leptospira licerasiae serovar Varillal str. VAR 010]EJZ40194.1 NRDE domain protein [Leptospira licerasiae str. MMD4847]